MSFVSYLVNMGIDLGLIVVGIFGLIGAISMFIQGDAILATLLFATALVATLYTRYRAKEKGITY